MDQLRALFSFLDAHPIFYPLVVWPLITAFVSLAQDQLKARAPKVWAAFQASGLDLLGVLRLLLGKRLPPAPPLLALVFVAGAWTLPGCAPMTPAQADQTSKAIEAGVDAGLELADHICEATGKKNGFALFACTFIGHLAPDNGKSDMVEIGPDRAPIVVRVPEAQAEAFAKRHSPETLSRISEGGR